MVCSVRDMSIFGKPVVAEQLNVCANSARLRYVDAPAFERNTYAAQMAAAIPAYKNEIR